MAKRRTPHDTVSTAMSATVPLKWHSRAPAKPREWGPAIRETVESLAVAFILAFLFRGFEAEAFVIPTGSMAPTLMGAHKDLLCPECGYRYQAGASSESDDAAQQQGFHRPIQEIVAVTCPLCRYTASVDPRTERGREYPTYGGDRILVAKFAFAFDGPRRWDVTVFKYPGGAQTNYIKRLVGMPGETVRIWHGDLYFKADGEQQFHFDRRDPAKLRVMAQMVYDNDYVDDAMTKKGWPIRWAPLLPDAPCAPLAGWTSDDGGRTYTSSGSSTEADWLAYRHYVPSIRDWELLKKPSLPQDYQPRPRLVTDFCAYNTSLPRGAVAGPQQLGLHWVGDLMLECQVDVTKADGKAIFELVKGGRHFRCTIDCQSGEAQLSIDDRQDFHPTAHTALRGLGRHHVIFSNFDKELVLWIDGSPVKFDSATSYDALDVVDDHPQASLDEPGDLAPARIEAQRAEMKISHLRLWRDIYYVAVNGGNWVSDYDYPQARLSQLSYDDLLEFWSTPALWSPQGSRGGPNPFDERREAIFPLSADQFFVLGDNSPLSQDARLWPAERYVSRDLLVGKAVFIFWPHSFDKFPGTNIPFPFFPNFARMGFIR